MTFTGSVSTVCGLGSLHLQENKVRTVDTKVAVGWGRSTCDCTALQPSGTITAFFKENQMKEAQDLYATVTATYEHIKAVGDQCSTVFGGILITRAAISYIQS
jgi:hypothetical protein